MATSTLLPAGYTVLETEKREGSRPILLDLWYPASPTAAEASFDYKTGAMGKVAVDAPPLDEAAPVVVLSHGVYGTARNYSWLTEDLARRGYIVAGVSHYGESPVYGPQTVNSASPLQPWERPRDCSAALDFLLTHPRFGRLADPLRIGAIGHSSGGAAVLALAGAVYDPGAMHEYCASETSRGDRCCRTARALSREEEELARRSYRDERIHAVVALDPSLGPGHNARSLSGVAVPVHIVGTVENDFLPFEHNAGRYARLIPGASLTPLAHGEGHFVFVDECSEDSQIHGVPVCRDRDGVQRAAVHARLAEIIEKFLSEHLK
jgi:predicted dienelactone hydrolase